MTRITISLPEDLANALAREARRQRESVSSVARQAIRAHLSGGGAEGHGLPFVALGKSGHRHTARDAEEILAGEWARDRGR